jgi:hypothetical protein
MWSSVFYIVTDFKWYYMNTLAYYLIFIFVTEEEAK